MITLLITIPFFPPTGLGVVIIITEGVVSDADCSYECSSLIALLDSFSTVTFETCITDVENGLLRIRYNKNTLIETKH